MEIMASMESTVTEEYSEPKYEFGKGLTEDHLVKLTIEMPTSKRGEVIACLMKEFSVKVKDKEFIVIS